MVDDPSQRAEQAGIDEGGLDRALEVLIDAVAKEVRPGGFELKLAASTLRDLLQDRTPESYALAVRAFNAIDRETRSRIQASAEGAATVYCTKTGKMTARDPVTPSAPAKSRMSGLFNVLGFGSGGGKGPAARKPG